ncbi:Two-component signal transduction system YycFG, regulatory protein YycI [Paenibacillus algorifonticola]|uniref:Two-component signal transduction system YycFG, regulatory protein YycI n=1 Tax=Paenibacillus algorifonticola TaxID=684063 RepID=A0A1I2DQ92_9BACL|nr:two-component system regulatory protein YycI [Paenibacillus algorifonticola]SFE82441.1 Two-component signal transduction system YycFG, regulatory protein YycI [Paenibacillus algorifonticola]
MDWSRAKSVLIGSFLLLNILLGYQVWLEVREQLDINNHSAELPPETVAVMKQKRIELNANLPLETPSMRDLTYQLKSQSLEEQEVVKLETPVDSRIVFSQTDLLTALGNQIPDIEQYAFDPLGSKAGVFVLYRMVDNRPLFEVRLELYSSNQKITGFKQSRIEVLESNDAKQQTVLPAAKAVAPFIERNLPDGSVITDIQLGYHGQTFDTETQVSAPYWRVLVEDADRPYYIHAVSGEVAQDKEQ